MLISPQQSSFNITFAPHPELMKSYLSAVLLAIPVMTVGLLSQDSSFWNYLNPPDQQTEEFDHRHLLEFTHYVEMDDGIKLAVNVYLPEDHQAGEKLPTVLYQTRYWRAIGFKWPFNKRMKMVPSTENFDPLDFVHYGYALVSVDVRGSGASYGLKTLTLPDIREVMDSKQMVQWITEQPWSDGNVGSTGISYIGNTALYQLIDPHPNLKAIAPLYSVFDLYDDVSAPGGIYFHQFISSYGDFCETLDRNTLPPWRRSFKTDLATYGVQRVDGHSKKDFDEIIQDHQCNMYHRTEGGTAEFMDDTTTLNGYLNVNDVLSPHFFIKEMKQSKIPIYSWSGWWDAAFQHSAIKQFINLDNGQHLLRLGPWNHGGGANVSPAQANRSAFDDVKEVARFFDHHLKGIDNGLYDEPRVKYYTIGADEWRNAETWPPESRTRTMFLADSGRAKWAAPTITSSFSEYAVDTTHGMGDDCRWNFSTSHYGITYSDRAWQDSITLSFTGPELSEDLEVTGHPVVTVHLQSDRPDGSIFVYLEDVDEFGNAWSVTEGQLRLIHRSVQGSAPYYQDCVPYHSYTKKDSEPMDPAKVETIVMDLYPTSHLFRKGHKLRVRLAGTDSYNFKNLFKGDEANWKVYHDAERASSISLPIVTSSLAN